MIEADVFRAQVTLPAGEWRLVAFPHGRGALGDFGPGYRDPIHIVVEDEPGAASPIRARLSVICPKRAGSSG